MEKVVHRGRYIPVAGEISNRTKIRKGEIRFSVCGTTFSLPEKSTYAKMIKGAERAIIVYEIIYLEKFPRVIEVIPNYSGQQVLQVNSRFPAWFAT